MGRLARAATLLAVCVLICIQSAAAGQSGAQSSSIPEKTSKDGAQAPSLPAATLAGSTLAEMDVMSAKLKDAIQRKHFSRVLVLGAAGPEFKISELGSMVGEAFTASLEKQAQGFEVISRQTLLQNLQSTDLDESMADTDAMVDFLCSRLHAKALVLVKLDQVEEDHATASVYLFEVHEFQSKSIAGWHFQIPLDDALRQANADLLPKGQEPIPDGVKPPMCAVCPRPDYSSEARSKKFQGTVLLSVLVGADGKVTDIKITKGGPWGINEKAIEAVKAWKFKPATGPDGRPVAQRISLEIVFQLLP